MLRDVLALSEPAFRFRSGSSKHPSEIFSKRLDPRPGRLTAFDVTCSGPFAFRHVASDSIAQMQQQMM
jgi:hypothetical protein